MFFPRGVVCAAHNTHLKQISNKAVEPGSL